jgi:hypothetical protein
MRQRASSNALELEILAHAVERAIGFGDTFYYSVSYLGYTSRLNRDMKGHAN